MPRLHIASGMFQVLMLTDREVFMKDPYAHARRALMLADTLIAAHEITSPQTPGHTNHANDFADVEMNIALRAAKAEFAMRHLAGSSSPPLRKRAQ